MIRNIFFNKDKKTYFLLVKEEELNKIFCGHCKAIIEIGRSFIIQRSFSKKEYTQHIFCQNCVKHNRKQIYDEFLTCYLTSIIPDNSILIPEIPPPLQEAQNATVWSAAVSNKGITADTSNTEVIDHTKLSGKFSLQGATIGDTSKVNELDSYEEDAFKLLDSKPVEVKKRITNKR